MTVKEGEDAFAMTVKEGEDSLDKVIVFAMIEK
jgi:hypothetical protein